jgi:hypothetical protein
MILFHRLVHDSSATSANATAALRSDDQIETGEDDSENHQHRDEPYV